MLGYYQAKVRVRVEGIYNSRGVHWVRIKVIDRLPTL